MTARSKIAFALVVASLACVAPRDARAIELLANGGFESGFAGWVVVDQPFGDGSFFVQSGAASPLNAFAVPPPPEGVQAAMSDQEGPGSHVLYQDFLVPASVTSATLTFQLFVNSFAPFATPSTLDFAPDPNQQARVDILAASADPFSLAAADVLLNAFRTLEGDPLVSGYTLYSVDITALLAAHAGQMLRLRFAEVDNLLFFNLGVDDVRITVDEPGRVPEPATWMLALAGLLALRIAGARRRPAT